jgi:hypothetical protein
MTAVINSRLDAAASASLNSPAVGCSLWVVQARGQRQRTETLR